MQTNNFNYSINSNNSSLSCFRYWYDEDNSEIWQELHNFAQTPDKEFIISASVAPSILGYGYKSIGYTWELYTGIRKEIHDEHTQKILDYGKNMEPYALHEFFTHWPTYVGIKPGMLFAKNSFWLCCSYDNLAMLDYSYINFNRKDLNLLNIETKSPNNGTILT